MVRVVLDWRTFGVGGHGPYLRIWGSDEAPRGEGWEPRVARGELQDHAVYEGGMAVDFVPRPVPGTRQGLPDGTTKPLWSVRNSVAAVQISAEAMAHRLGVALEVLGEPPDAIQPEGLRQAMEDRS
jgi:hypothetical protein